MNDSAKDEEGDMGVTILIVVGCVAGLLVMGKFFAYRGKKAAAAKPKWSPQIERSSVLFLNQVLKAIDEELESRFSDERFTEDYSAYSLDEMV